MSAPGLQLPEERSLLSRSLPRLDADGQSTEIGRRMTFVLCAVLLSIGAGMAVVQLDPIFIAGLLLGGVFVLTILRWPFLGLLFYLLIFLLRLGELVPALAPLRMERIVGMLTLGSLLLAQVMRDGKLSFDRSRMTKRFLFLLFAAIASVPTSYWVMGSKEGVNNFLKLFIFYLLIVQLVDTRRKFLTFVFVYGALIAYIAAQSTGAYLAGSLLVAQGIERAIGVTSAGGGPNELGATMACTIPLFLLLGLQGRLGMWRWLFLGAALLFAFTLATTGSRSGLVGFMAAVGYLVWTSRHRLVLGVAAFVVLSVAYVLLPDQYQTRYSTMAQSTLDGSSQERLKVWGKGLRMVVDRPITGVGVNAFQTANAFGYSGGARRSWLESHSLYVQVPAEMGLLGAFAFFGLLYEMMRTNRRLRSRLVGDEDTWRLESLVLKGMFAGAIALLFTGIWGHSMMRYTWYVFAALCVALSRIYVQTEAGDRDEDRAELLGHS